MPEPSVVTVGRAGAQSRSPAQAYGCQLALSGGAFGPGRPTASGEAAGGAWCSVLGRERPRGEMSMEVPAGSEPSRIDVIEKPIRRLACLSDIHGNTAALEAVLRSAEFAAADAVAMLGCVTAGPDPRGTLRRCMESPIPTYFLAGNGERAILEMAAGNRPTEGKVDEWLVATHTSGDLQTMAAWPSGLSCRLTCGTTIRLCHGSPRSDIEVLTPATPEDRLRQAFAAVSEEVVAHGHTHLQYQRHAAGHHVVGPGSVGIPHTDGPFGARWALIGEQTELIVTSYEIEDAARLITTTGYPGERFLKHLRAPIPPAELIAEVERLQFAD
jgi:predicted phosphodiesterase